MSASLVLRTKLANLSRRNNIINTIRSFFAQEGYLEVDTPLLVPHIAPEAHITPLIAGNLFLQTSPEICMKRLVAAGFQRIYQISHCWRSGERGKLHLPEFTMLEWYQAHSDYLELMKKTVDLLRAIAREVNGALIIDYGGRKIALDGEWEKLTVNEAFARYGRCGMEQALSDDEFDTVMVEDIEPMLGIDRPTFIYDYPACRSALARLKEPERTVAERFELYIAGIELANGFSELIDPVEQRSRFIAELAAKPLSDQTAGIPETFLAELGSMPPTAGIAVGIDRLVMLLCDATAIDEVVAFTPELLS